MHRFVGEAQIQFSIIETEMAQMHEAYKDCVKFYGEDPSIMKPDEFFGIFKTFMSSFEVCKDFEA
jgi:cytokinesis protein